MLGRPATAAAIKLFHDGIRVMSEMTCNGFPVDVDAIRDGIASCNRLMRELETEAWTMDGGAVWKSTYGEAATLSNATQAKHVFYDVLGFSPSDEDEEEASTSMDKDALADIDHPLADVVARYRKLDKCAGTFLNSLLVENVNGLVHPFFSLAQAISYRSSSTDPNGQNMPVRDPETAGFVRKAIRAPAGYRIVESDYSGIEVVMAACYHKDKRMISYLQGGDMHKDMACECYLLPHCEDAYWKKEGKKVRYSAKNGFVFPEFYGSYWSQVAVSLWKNIVRLDLRTPALQPLSEHLKKQGISGLGKVARDEKGRPTHGPKGSFYRHVEEVERHFWNDRFPEYNQWRKDWYSAYQRQGHFQSLTGFNYAGLFRRNQVINLPVQGSASHLKLQALINMYRQMCHRKMRSRLILEIHDSIIGLVPDCEFDLYQEIIQTEMVEAINKQFAWLVVPVKVEVEASPSGGSWHDKKLVSVHT